MHLPCLRRVATLFLVASVCVSCTRPPTERFAVAPVGMDPKGPYIAERSGALAFWGNGTLESPVELAAGSVVITVRARGNVVGGEAPRLRVTLGGTEAGVIEVSSGTLRDYSLTAPVDDDGQTSVKLAFDNYLKQPQLIRSRYVFIETVTVEGR